MHQEIERILTARVTANPYRSDGSFAASIALLPRGLRAMAATHRLDLSLTLDSMTYHFRNFGEAGLVAETEAGLRELGLLDLAACFKQAKELVMPLLTASTGGPSDFDGMLAQAGLQDQAETIDNRAWDLAGKGESAIYQAWIRYARRYPERVFGDAIA